MNAILLCPSPGPAMEHLASFAPLAAIPLLGESLVEYWLTELAMSGAREVRLLAHDRPERIAALAGNGARWGLSTEVIAESRDLTPAQAQIKYASRNGSPDEIIVLDHLPGSAQPLFTSYADLFAELLAWLPKALTPDRVGVRELRPGVKVGWHTRIAPDAQLHAPCWIGHSVYIGARAVVGPMAVVEDRSFVEPEANVSTSLIGPDTFVGKSASIQNSLAWGDTVIHLKSGLCLSSPTAFLVRALRQRAVSRRPETFLGALGEIYSRNKDDLQMFWQFLLNKEG